MLVTSNGLIEELKDKPILLNICTFLNKKSINKTLYISNNTDQNNKRKEFKKFLVHIKQKGLIIN